MRYGIVFRQLVLLPFALSALVGCPFPPDSKDMSSDRPPSPPASQASRAPGVVWVDFSYAASDSDGSDARPYINLTQAASAAGSGDTIRIRGGVSATSSPERLRIAKPVRIEASGGAVDIGDGSVNALAPNVVNASQSAAQSALVAAGLTAGTVSQRYHAAIPAGNVIGQNAIAGRILARGTAVALAVSKGPRPSSVRLFAVNSGQNRRAISRYIYGDNYFSEWDMTRNLALARIGGNRWSAYNWENNASNSGIDLNPDDPTESYNDGYLSESDTPGAAVQSRVSEAFGGGAAALITVPMIGYVAADKNGLVDSDTPNYLSARFRQSVADKPGALLLNPSLADAVVYQEEFVNWAEQTFYPGGHAPGELPLFYSLDNEPDLWQSTHPAIHGDATTYAELVSRTIAYASMIKSLNPQAVVFGPASYGWWGYVTLQDAPDGEGRDFLDFYLDSMRQAEQTSGTRLVDVLDLHWYPEATDANWNRVTDAWNNDPAVVAARLQCPRSLWDPTYVENSWIVDNLDGAPVNLIPRMLGKIASHYPGTKLAFTEYYYGGGSHISSGIAHADVLGILGREGVYAAMTWRQGDAAEGDGTLDTFLAGAFAVYRNYNGSGGQFGDTSVLGVTDNWENSSVYASVDAASPNRMVIVAINKTSNALVTDIEVNHPVQFGRATCYRLTAANPVPQAAGTITGIAGNGFEYTLPAMSVCCFVLGV